LAVCLGVWFFAARPGKNKIRNVLLISIDTCRADHLSCYGYKKKTTPNIDAIAAEGILFENVVAPTPLTLPSHSSMLTGTIPIYHGVHDNIAYRLAESNITLAEILKEAGFVTGAAVSAFVLDSQFGIDQGFDSFNDRFKSPLEDSAVEQRRGDETTGLCLDWLEENQERKFFYFLHYYDPHADYEPPEPFAFIFPSSAYAGEIAYTDHCIGQVVAKLKELDLYDSTLIIITADHGEMLGEHGEITHGLFIYNGVTSIPFVIKVPGRSDAVRIKSTAGLIDIVPTVCSLLDIEPPAAVVGVDLSVCFGGSELSAKRGLYCESLQSTKYNANSLLGIVTDRFKYIQTTRPELYDIVNDPAESNNLIDEKPDRGRILKDRLAWIIEESIRRDSADSKADLDDETRRRLESLGYVGGSVVEGFDFDQTKDDPKDVLDYHIINARVVLLFAQKKYDQAMPLAEKMIQQRPDCSLGYRKKGNIALMKGDYSQAIVNLQKAIEIGPNKPRILNNLAWLCSTDEDSPHYKPAEAIRLAQKACSLTDYKDFELLDTLSVAYAATGDFAKAIEAVNLALQLVGDNERRAVEFRKHLELYKVNKPYREKSIQVDR
jgi:arylsulfatase A-like enzyme